jgi:hypothetical protein
MLSLFIVNSNFNIGETALFRKQIENFSVRPINWTACPVIAGVINSSADILCRPFYRA